MPPKSSAARKIANQKAGSKIGPGSNASSMYSSTPNLRGRHFSGASSLTGATSEENLECRPPFIPPGIYNHDSSWDRLQRIKDARKIYQTPQTRIATAGSVDNLLKDTKPPKHTCTPRCWTGQGFGSGVKTCMSRSVPHLAAPLSPSCHRDKHNSLKSNISNENSQISNKKRPPFDYLRAKSRSSSKLLTTTSDSKPQSKPRQPLYTNTTGGSTPNLNKIPSKLPIPKPIPPKTSTDSPSTRPVPPKKPTTRPVPLRRITQTKNPAAQIHTSSDSLDKLLHTNKPVSQNIQKPKTYTPPSEYRLTQPSHKKDHNQHNMITPDSSEKGHLNKSIESYLSQTDVEGGKTFSHDSLDDVLSSTPRSKKRMTKSSVKPATSTKRDYVDRGKLTSDSLDECSGRSGIEGDGDDEDEVCFAERSNMRPYSDQNQHHPIAVNDSSSEADSSILDEDEYELRSRKIMNSSDAKGFPLHNLPRADAPNQHSHLPINSRVNPLPSPGSGGCSKHNDFLIDIQKITTPRSFNDLKFDQIFSDHITQDESQSRLTSELGQDLLNANIEDDDEEDMSRRITYWLHKSIYYQSVPTVHDQERRASIEVSQVKNVVNRPELIGGRNISSISYPMRASYELPDTMVIDNDTGSIDDDAEDIDKSHREPRIDDIGGIKILDSQVITNFHASLPSTHDPMHWTVMNPFGNKLIEDNATDEQPYSNQPDLIPHFRNLGYPVKMERDPGSTNDKRPHDTNSIMSCEIISDYDISPSDILYGGRSLSTRMDDGWSHEIRQKSLSNTCMTIKARLNPPSRFPHNITDYVRLLGLVYIYRFGFAFLVLCSTIRFFIAFIC